MLLPRVTVASAPAIPVATWSTVQWIALWPSVPPTDSYNDAKESVLTRITLRCVTVGALPREWNYLSPD
jgi:hypothetical protein